MMEVRPFALQADLSGSQSLAHWRSELRLREEQPRDDSHIPGLLTARVPLDAGPWQVGPGRLLTAPSAL